MLLESMAGKGGACNGIPQDGTPFRFSEKHRAVDFFGEQLKSAGFNYHGTEPVYSGIYGTGACCPLRTLERANLRTWLRCRG